MANRLAMHEAFYKQPGTAELTSRIEQLEANVRENPFDSNHWSTLAVALRCKGHLLSAISAYRRALTLEPDAVSTLSNLGGALRATGEFAEAIHHLEHAVRLSPNFAAAHFNLGLVLEDLGDLDQAVISYDNALKLEPGRTDAILQKAFCLLRKGNLREGFELYERRLQFEPRLNRGFQCPVWRGQNFSGKTILLHSEQGLGDTFQFIRYTSAVKERGGTVIVECPKTLVDLTKEAVGVDAVIAQGEPPPPLDYRVSLMSLPFCFGIDLANIPATVPYLKVPAKFCGSVRLNARRNKTVRVGIAWESGHEDVGAHRRSAPLEKFLSLLEINGVSLYSLQVGPGRSQLEATGSTYLVQDLSPRLSTFAHTADAITQLDLVVSVDTGIVHLAGALGKPVWILLPYIAEWRWLQYRADSPWYPTAKLFRQPAPFDWSPVFHQVANALRTWIENEHSDSVLL